MKADNKQPKKKGNKVVQWAVVFCAILVFLAGVWTISSPEDGQMDDSVPPVSDQINPGEQQETDYTAPPSDGSKSENETIPDTPIVSEVAVTLSEIPAYSGDPFIAINENVPSFTNDELITTSFETYSPLDSLGRCGVAYACIGIDLMPTEDRGSISEVTPSGWLNKEYDGQYLYNRCHLIGFQLSGENANERNLITGTRYMNVEGMLPFENMIADYVQETDNHVLYRVTPIFDGNNLVASGVQLEAESVEDGGDGVLFNVYVYNVQPGISIDYATGESWQETSAVEQPVQEEPAEQTPATTGTTYVLNTNSKKFHYPTCSSVDDMSPQNREDFTGTRDQVIAMGYDPCKRCNP